MATRHCFAAGLPLLLLAFLVSVPASAELRPVKVWQCTIPALEPGLETEGPPDRTITLYEYRSPENCLDEALPPAGNHVCRADYTKDGTTETLWRARNKRNYCRPRAEALVRDLVDAGFFCKTLDAGECEGSANVKSDAVTVVDAQPVAEAKTVSEAEPTVEAKALPATEPDAGTRKMKTPTASAIPGPAPIDKTAGRENQLTAFFNGLFDASLAKAMTGAAIPDEFNVLDSNTLSAGDGATLRFTRGTHAWETRRDTGVLVINADFQHEQSFNDVFFGFAFDRSGSTNSPSGHHFRYLGVVSPETPSEVIYAGEDKIIISSRWYTEPGDCYSSRTTDEYQWSDSIYGTLQMRTISEEDNPDCEDSSGKPPN